MQTYFLSECGLDLHLTVKV